MVITNYNQSNHTVECIESLLKNDYRNYQIIIVDNGSTDNSVEQLKLYLSGKLPFEATVPPPIRDCVYPITTKPLPYCVFDYNRETKEKYFLTECTGADTPQNCFCTIIKNPRNGHFTEGNNIGIAIALKRGDADFLWLLNNDTVIARDAITPLVKYYQSHPDKKIGIIGSKLLFYDEPDMIQAVAGRFNKLKAWPEQIGTFQIDRGQFDTMPVKADYVVGAALFLPKQFISDVGLLDEVYVAYSEELDWCTRGALKGYETHACLASKVYHKQGVSSGSKVKNRRKPLFAMYYHYRNLLLFYKKYYPRYRIFIWLRIFLQGIRKLFQGSTIEFRLFIFFLFHPPTWKNPVRFEESGFDTNQKSKTF